MTMLQKRIRLVIYRRVTKLWPCSTLLLLVFIMPSGYADINAEQLVDAAKERTHHFVIYNGKYRSIDYPNGDVPKNIGVCTDVIIRAYRTIGIDLQERVHLDMKENFDRYPSKRMWGLTRTDSNIDHRRVPNLQTFFSRQGLSLPVTNSANDYLPGDIVTWMLRGNAPHIGIVVDFRSSDGERPLIVHNIGFGPKMNDMLFDYEITGHYRYLPDQ